MLVALPEWSTHTIILNSIKLMCVVFFCHFIFSCWKYHMNLNYNVNNGVILQWSIYYIHPFLDPHSILDFFYTKTVVAMLDNFGVTCTFEFFITIGLLMAIPFSAGTYTPWLSLCRTSSLKTWLPHKLFVNAKFYWKTTPFIHCPLCVHCITSITTPQTTVLNFV